MYMVEDIQDKLELFVTVFLERYCKLVMIIDQL